MALNERQIQIISEYQEKGGSALFFGALPYPVRYNLVDATDNMAIPVRIDVTGYLQGREIDL